MDEYIEREALRKVMQMATDDPTCPMHIATTIDQYITEAPAADVVPVVRCRECSHGTPCVDGYVRCSHPSGKSILMKSSDFCSYGERKEGAD